MFKFLLLAAASTAQQICQKQKPVGAYCLSDEWCQSNICANFECVPKLPKLDEPCLDFHCAKGYGCDLNRNTTCQELPLRGQECAMSPLGPTLCHKGLGCYDGICSEFKTQLNSTCTDLFNDCAPGFGCSFLETGQSACVELKKAGQKCNAYDCVDGLYCDIDSTTCVKLLDVGGDCTSTGVCKEDLDCKPESNSKKPKFTCQKPSNKVGTTCTTQCADGLYCGPFE